MTEFRAISFIIAATSLAAVAVFIGLTALQASGALYALAMFLIIGLGADTCSRVGMRYDAKRRGH